MARHNDCIDDQVYVKLGEALPDKHFHKYAKRRHCRGSIFRAPVESSSDDDGMAPDDPHDNVDMDFWVRMKAPGPLGPPRPVCVSCQVNVFSHCSLYQ